MFLHLFIYVYMCDYMCDMPWYMCGHQRKALGNQFSFHQVVPRDQTQVIRLGNHDLYLLIHLAGLMTAIFKASACSA